MGITVDNTLYNSRGHVLAVGYLHVDGASMTYALRVHDRTLVSFAGYGASPTLAQAVRLGKVDADKVVKALRKAGRWYW